MSLLATAPWARSASGSSIIDTLKGQVSLEEHGGRTPAGVMARVAQRLLALGAGVWWNWQIGAREKRSLVAYDH